MAYLLAHLSLTVPFHMQERHLYFSFGTFASLFYLLIMPHVWFLFAYCLSSDLQRKGILLASSRIELLALNLRNDVFSISFLKNKSKVSSSSWIVGAFFGESLVKYKCIVNNRKCNVWNSFISFDMFLREMSVVLKNSPKIIGCFMHVNAELRNSTVSRI